MKARDDRYPLQPDYSFDASLSSEGQLIAAGMPEIPAGNISWLLEVDYKAQATFSEPCITFFENETRLFTQYLERGQQGQRWLNLSGISTLDSIALEAQHCRLGEKMRLHGFSKPALEQGPILIIAPHPDDAELAAYGLYSRLSEQVWIVTLSVGENQKNLQRQYLPGLDGDSTTASRRKGGIRAWNSATTPMLAGVPPERLIMLGYFNDTLAKLMAEPSLDIPWVVGRNQPPHQAKQAAEVQPSHFRSWNRMALPSDTASANRGDLLVDDLAHVIDQIKPRTIVVTHPEVDPHKDHIAAAQACAVAMQQAGHVPDYVLLYANHLRGVRRFPYGPPHASATLWPLELKESTLGAWSFHSETLSEETQREKAVAMDTMHDLRARSRLEKRMKQWLYQRLSGVHYARYGEHEYFRTHIKAHEVFAVVSGQTFQRGIGC